MTKYILDYDGADFYIPTLDCFFEYSRDNKQKEKKDEDTR